jgi:hypothetical protein
MDIKGYNDICSLVGTSPQNDEYPTKLNIPAG